MGRHACNTKLFSAKLWFFCLGEIVILFFQKTKDYSSVVIIIIVCVLPYQLPFVQSLQSDSTLVINYTLNNDVKWKFHLQETSRCMYHFFYVFLSVCLKKGVKNYLLPSIPVCFFFVFFFVFDCLFVCLFVFVLYHYYLVGIGKSNKPLSFVIQVAIISALIVSFYRQSTYYR